MWVMESGGYCQLCFRVLEGRRGRKYCSTRCRKTAHYWGRHRGTMLPQCWIRVAKERGIIRRYRRGLSADELGRIENAVREFGLACLPVRRQNENVRAPTPADWLEEKRGGMWALGEIVGAAARREMESADAGVVAKMEGVRVAADNLAAAKNALAEQQRRVGLAGELLAVAAADALPFLPVHLLKHERRVRDDAIARENAGDDEVGLRVAKGGQTPKTGHSSKRKARKK